MRPQRLELMVCLFVVLATVSAFWQVLNHDFLYYDDNLYVTENHHVQGGLTWEGVIWAFTATDASNWHPLTWLSHMLDCQIYGLKPGGHHLTSLLFHIANTLLLFMVLKRMTGTLWRSALVAVLFALHPLHVESVAWVAERKDVLSTFFWMITMYAYVRYVKYPGFSRYLLVLVFFALGLMAKPMLVTLPFMLLLMDYWPLRRFEFGYGRPQPQKSMNLSYQILLSLHFVWEKVPLFALVAASSVVTLLAQRSGGALTSLDRLPLNVRMANAIVSYVSYMAKMIWPLYLAVIYPYPGMLPTWQVAGAILLLVCISVLAIRAVRLYPFLAVGWLWYLGTLVPVIGLVQVGKQCMADRYTYVPLIGLFIIIAWGVAELVARWHYRRLVLTTFTGVILLAFVICAWLQVRHWRNGIVLFRHALDVTANNYLAHDNLGIALARQGSVNEAITHFSKALQIRPNYAEAHNNLGAVLAGQDRLEEAIGHFSRALQIDPHLAEGHESMGLALARQGRLEEAISHFLKALQIKPDSAEVHNNLGIVLARQGRLEEAISHFLKTLQIKPDSAEVRANLRRALQLADKSEMVPNTSAGH